MKERFRCAAFQFLRSFCPLAVIAEANNTMIKRCTLKLPVGVGGIKGVLVFIFFGILKMEPSVSFNVPELFNIMQD